MVVSANTVPSIPQKSVRPWIVLAGILAFYLFNVERWNPRAFFGRFQDDSIYFSSAKALAQDGGYVIPSFPGTPPQTKYPFLYPWLLSWIWKLNPSFPNNLKQAVWLTEFFGCWALVVAFLLLRKLLGIGEWPALFLTGLCTVHPIFLRLSGSVMADLPFMALLLTAVLLADSAMRPGATLPLAVITGACAGLSVGLRTIGIAVIAGIFLAAVWRRAYRQAIPFCVAAGVVILIESLPVLFHHMAVQDQGDGMGWQQTWAYYADYGHFWRLSVPGIWALLNMMKLNLLLLVSGPGPFVIAPLGGPTTLLRAVLFSVLTVPIVAGIVRRERGQEWKPFHFVFLTYCAVLLVWPFPLFDRYFLPFLPLFFAGLWIEAPKLFALLRANLRRGAPLLHRALAATLAVILLGILVFAAWNYLVDDPRRLRLAAASRAHAMEERKQAYEWIREHTDSGVRIAAYDDVILYLYTGRQGLRPIAFLPSAEFMADKRILARDLAHIAEAARHARARFWLTSNDDFDNEAYRELIDARMVQVKAVLPVVFRSQQGTVQVRDASCLVETQRADCKAALPVLFPPEP
jgi:hypothetical protein